VEKERLLLPCNQKGSRDDDDNARGMLSINMAASQQQQQQAQSAQQQPQSQGIFSSLLQRVNPKPNYAAYTPYFSQLVSQIGAGNSVQRANTLQVLELYVTSHRAFEGNFPLASARKDLFTAWELLLNEAPSNLQAMDLILACMLRDELSLRSGLTGEDVREYERILWKTFAKAASLIKPGFAGQGFKNTVESFFASQVLAVFFFRLPGFGPVVVDGLNAKPREARSLKGFFVAPTAAKPARRSFRSSIAPPPVQLSSPRSGDATDGFSSSATPSQAKAAPSLSPPRTVSPSLAVESPEIDARERRFFACAPDLFNWTQRLQQLDNDRGLFVLNKEDVVRWTTQLATKDAFFLSFVETYAITVKRAVPANETPAWSAVPAYDLVLATFAPLLRSAVWWDSIVRRMPGQGVGWVTSLPGYLRVKKTACALLQSDPSLLSLFCHTVFECTNANSLLSVDSCVEHLNLFFTCAAVPGPQRPASSAAPQGLVTQSSKAGDSLPAQFEYDDFWESFGRLLDSEGFQVLLKVCSFLYNNVHLFHGKSRTRLVNDLLGRHFFRLFLHWSPEVRTAFQHVLVYKVLRADRRFLPCFSDSQVMLLYGTGRAKRVPVSSPRVAMSAKAAWGKSPTPAANASSSTPAATSTDPADQPATPDEVAQLTRSAQRRLALFDRANAVDDEELWCDMAFSSKIDSYVRMCLVTRDDDVGDAVGSETQLLPAQLKVYCESSLEQYALLLIRYYRGVTLNSLEDIPETLSHRMVISEFTTET